ncbi:MFS transporter [Sphingomonas koreensis]|jgi:nucleoside transporter|uniref:MFS transporter n=1 Tax=Sphingomonas koreensis TaxID=93064 RepID=A0A1L6JAW7_9SPHN|nr:MFS transporter [Sphingomonas koreensis]APR53062.1 MFS transporter [Sphingomonas koreensis]MDC7810264.1 MFS transporter [Sphingomonas koreensis]RSU17777.1 MFS transporter [Sphingomonas koreensis]RSU20891.1 MFS transporter [Sphingomonas koreensis]RSU23580.1 MFS transporter [Sphingomonas koreensis]
MATAHGAQNVASHPVSAMLMARLSALMFMQFFVWGAWAVTLGLVMQTVGVGNLIANAFSVGPIASIAGSFLLGMAATRYFSPKALMVILHLLGGAILLALPSLLTPESGGTFVWVLFGYMILYMPTVGLANTIALKSLGERDDRFPFVRAFGTLGWIVAGLIIGWAALSASPEIFRVAAVVSIALGIYSLTLPAIEPDAPSDESLVRQVLCVEAFGLMRQRSYLIFVICATLISIPLAMYYAYASAYIGAAGITNVGGTMSIGQMSELAFMFSMPWLYRRFGVKPLLLVGMAAWALRYALFAIGDGGASLWAVYLGVALHGVCYDFFFVAGAIYTGTIATPKGVNAQAQGMLTLFTYGVGMLLGSQIGGLLYAQLPAVPTIADWQQMWWYPAIAAAVITVLFQLLFRDDSKQGAAA